MQGFLVGIAVIACYFILMATLAVLLRRHTHISDEVFRKLLHYILQLSYLLFVFAFSTWWQAALCCAIIVVVAFPLLGALDRSATFASFVDERSHGEFQLSLVLTFGVLALCLWVCWGMLGDRFAVLACMYAWGIGDGAAALVGRRFGRHHLCWRIVDSHKSVEGSLAMVAASALAVAVVLLVRGGLAWPGYVIIPLAGALVAAFVEMCTRGGMDTLTCPLSAMAVILPLMAAFGAFA